MQQYIRTEELQNELKRADQIISISYTDRLPVTFDHYISDSIPHKFIHEHDRGGYSSHGETLYRPMGLSEGHYGIKLKPLPPTTTLKQKWEIIEQNDPDFAKKLIECTQVANFEAFYDQHVLMPVYLNANDVLFRMILPIIGGVDSTYPEDNKSLVIYHSGDNLIEFLEAQNTRMVDLNALIEPKKATRATTTIQMISMILENTNISRLEIFGPSEQEPIVIQGSSNGSKVFKIISGYYLSKPSFDALYHLSKIAGVSGDNTLEQCISMDILPFYRSYNHKWDTLASLDRIIQTSDLSISEEAKASFHLFFKKGIAPLIQRGQVTINLSEMLKAWPTVTAYLRENHNFYNKLDEIMLEDLPNEAKPTAFQSLACSL